MFQILRPLNMEVFISKNKIILGHVDNLVISKISCQTPWQGYIVVTEVFHVPTLLQGLMDEFLKKVNALNDFKIIKLVKKCSFCWHYCAMKWDCKYWRILFTSQIGVYFHIWNMAKTDRQNVYPRLQVHVSKIC